MLKIISMNVLIIFSILGAMNYIPPLVMTSYSAVVKLAKQEGTIDPYDKVSLPNYKNHGWISQYVSEHNELSHSYKDFVVLRRDPFAGETINIDENGIRKTFESGSQKSSKIWFFGGSTMWGSGSDDNNTIPSWFTQISRKNSINFGESGYTTRQNLNMLMTNLQIREKPEFVVFYDGVNNVGSQCRSEIDPPASSSEKRIAEKLRLNSFQHAAHPLSFRYQLETLVAFKGKIVQHFSSPKKNKNSLYNCHENPEKAKAIALSFASDWKYTRDILEARGIEFIPILQPVAYFSNTRKDHLNLSEIREKQYQAVYPLIIEELSRVDLKYYNLTKAFDLEEWLYIDFCHVSPNGNEIIARNIDSIIKGMSIDRG